MMELSSERMDVLKNLWDNQDWLEYCKRWTESMPGSYLYYAEIKREVPEDFISFIISLDIYGVVAGGYSRWLLEDGEAQKPSDIDIWPSNKDGKENYNFNKLRSLFEDIYGLSLSYESDISLNYKAESFLGISCGCIQLIKPNKFFSYKDIKELLETFDFSIVRAAIAPIRTTTSKRKAIHCVCWNSTVSSIQKKECEILYISNPVAIMYRMEKYRKLGYDFRYKEILKVIEYISNNKDKVDNIVSLSKELGTNADRSEIYRMIMHI